LHLVGILFPHIVTFLHCATAPSGPRSPIIEASRSHSDTPQSVGLLWTSDQPDAVTFTWHKTQHS